jgi:hypothetical protein
VPNTYKTVLLKGLAESGVLKSLDLLQQITKFFIGYLTFKLLVDLFERLCGMVRIV